VDLGQLAWTTLVIAVSCIPLGITLWALLDCARRPGWAWGLSGHDRLIWMFAILVGVLCVPVGILISGWYLVRIRPVIAGIEDGRLV
jgi:uncharacterized membrane protein